jgi:hypothetical protein
LQNKYGKNEKNIQGSIQSLSEEQRQAIFDKADLELNPYGNGCIIKCSNPDLEE